MSFSVACISQPSEPSVAESDSLPSSKATNTDDAVQDIDIEKISHADAESVINTYEKALETTGMSKEEAWETIHKFEKMISEGDAEPVINNFAHIISQPGARQILSNYEEMMSKDEARIVIGNWESLMNEGTARQIVDSFEKLLKRDGARKAIDEYEDSLNKADSPTAGKEPAISDTSNEIIREYSKIVEGEGRKVITSYNKIMKEDGSQQIISDYEKMVSDGNARQVISSYETLMHEEVSRQIISQYARIMTNEEGRKIISTYPTVISDKEKPATATKAPTKASKGFLGTPEPPMIDPDGETLAGENKQRSESSPRASTLPIIHGGGPVSEDDARKIIGNYDKTLNQRDDSRLIISTYVRSLGRDSSEL